MIYGNGSIRRTIVAHLDHGEDVLESLKRIVRAEGIKNGVILNGYGTLNRCRFHSVAAVGFPPKDEFYTVEGPFELLSLSGTIANGEIHVHVEVADKDHAFGGHLEPGSRVLYLCDVAIAELGDIDMAFEVRPKTGLKLLTVKPGREETGPSVEADERGNWVLCNSPGGAEVADR